MKGETITFIRNSSESKKPVGTISILVVDDDATCLTIVAAILRKLKYQVETVKHPNDALSRLRVNGGVFDLVISDVHMPDMNGFQLQQAITREFNLPVVLMSADDRENVALKALKSEASFFISKPVSSDDLRDLWQCATMRERRSQVDEVHEGRDNGSLLEAKNNSEDLLAVSLTSANEDTMTSKDSSKRKSPRRESSDVRKEENSQSSSKKKPKVIWTNFLHNRFLEAIRSIGLDRAVPKKILEVMNVPGLTRENVASHLQKYRIFLRRVSDASYKIQYSADKGLNRNLRPSLESSRASPSTPTLSRHNKFQNVNSRKFPATARLAHLPAYSSSLVTESGIRKSLLSNKGSLIKPNVGTTNLIHQNDRQYARFGQNNYQTSNSSIQGHRSSVSLEDRSRAPPASALSASFDTSMNPSTSMGTLNTVSSLVPSKIFACQTNYVGYNLSNLKDLAGPGPVEKYTGLKNSCGGTMNLPVDDDHLQSIRPVPAAAVTSDDMNMDQLVQHADVGSSSNAILPDNSSGGQLSDAVAYYQMLPRSDQPLVSEEKSADKNIHEQSQATFSPMFDLPKFNVWSTQQLLEAGGFGTTVADQVKIKKKAQHNAGQGITNFNNIYGGMSLWNNLVPSFDQAPNPQCSKGLIYSHEFGISSQHNKTALLQPIELQGGGEGLSNPTESSQLNKTLLCPTERDDDEFLQYLLAPFGEDQTLEGI